MGPVNVQPGEAVYADANVLIYSVERVQPYAPTLDAFSRDVGALQRPALTSELTALEVLVGPLKAGDTALEALFRTALYASPDLRRAPVSRSILERAASLRATMAGLKTPDAIHAATALEHHCDVLLTNDPVFRRMPGLRVEVLHDLLTP